MIVLKNTPGVVGVYLMAAIFQTIIKLVEEVNDSCFLSTICIKMLLLYPLRHVFSLFLSSTGECHMGLKLFGNLYLLISLQVTLLPSDVASLLMRLKLSNSFGALCLCLPPKASHYAHFVACLL